MARRNQIIRVLREQEARARVADLCRKHGILEVTFHNWKAEYGGMEVSETKRLKALEEETVKLKKLLAEHTPDGEDDQKSIQWIDFRTSALRELLAKNGRACRQA